MIKEILWPWSAVKSCFVHVFEVFEILLGDKIAKRFVLAILSLLIAWHIYTPIHELFHVAGCLLGGGTVEELALSPQYGAHLLKHIFPFIVAESEYAGQLSGFSTPNYWAYALTDFFPYLLSLPGVILMELSRRKRWIFLFGPALILIMVPLTSIPGDFYEMASLVTTQIGEAFGGSAQAGYLISDDVFKLVSTLHENGILSVFNTVMVLVGFILAAYLASATLALEWVIAKKALTNFPSSGEDKTDSTVNAEENSKPNP